MIEPTPLKFPKPGKKAKAEKLQLSKWSKKKMDNGVKQLENECMNLWRQIVSFGKDCCEWDGKPHFVYQCHHVITKGSSKALKFDTDNGVHLGKGSHYSAHNHGSMDFSRWFDKKFPGRYDRLLLRKHNHCPQTVSNLTLIKIGLEKELKALNDIH